MLAALFVLLQAAPVPPVPPPPRPSHEAAIRLWEEHPPPEAWRQGAIDRALGIAAGQALAAAGIRPGQRRWLEQYDALRQRLRAYIPADRPELDRRATACAAEGVAYQMTVQEIEEVRRSLSTPAGSNFWSATAIGYESLQSCYQRLLMLAVTEADYRAVGLRPPRPRNRRVHVVS